MRDDVARCRQREAVAMYAATIDDGSRPRPMRTHSRFLSCASCSVGEWPSLPSQANLLEGIRDTGSIPPAGRRMRMRYASASTRRRNVCVFPHAARRGQQRRHRRGWCATHACRRRCARSLSPYRGRWRTRHARPPPRSATARARSGIALIARLPTWRQESRAQRAVVAPDLSWQRVARRAMPAISSASMSARPR